MDKNEIEIIVEKIRELDPLPQSGWRLGVPREYLVNRFIISNNEMEDDSHLNSKIESYDDVVQIISTLIKPEFIDEVLQTLKDESEYDENKKMYFHYIKSISL